MKLDLSTLTTLLKGAEWRKRLLYVAFGGFCFLLFLIVTFPYDAFTARLKDEASNAGLYLSVGDMGPGFFSVHASKVDLSKKADDGDSAPPKPLRISFLSLRPSLFPLGLAFSAELLSGEISGALGGSGDQRIKLAWSNLDLSDPSFESLTGVRASGKLRGKLDLTVPTVRSEHNGPTLDFAQAQGSASLQGAQLSILGGTVPVPMGGSTIPMDVPATSLGVLAVTVKVDSGQGTFDKLSLSGGDLELDGSGSVDLKQNPAASPLSLELKLKVEPEFQKKLGLLGSGLTLLQPDSGRPGWRVAKIAGVLGQPRYIAGR